ncbi:hypothetical protein HGM15179_007871 [Zosterops borbonicus]|uniref:ribonuclease H n=1 Tax=Zosterops borbonicus TaxID=364589 RepID=A0A8K1GJ88_9PASS|nr:hypothetical protein HGM15179_007871 [Zosterops borbonicus]
MDKAIIHHYMDDVLMWTSNDDLLTHALDLTVIVLVAAGFKLQESKIQRMPPWRYLGLEISKQTIVPQKLATKTKIETVADVHQLCGALNWASRWDPDLPFHFIILGRVPHLYRMIFQWDKGHITSPKKDQGKRGPLLIIEWVFLSHQRSKRMTRAGGFNPEGQDPP